MRENFNGKGSRDRTTDKARYKRNFDAIRWPSKAKEKTAEKEGGSRAEAPLTVAGGV